MQNGGGLLARTLVPVLTLVLALGGACSSGGDEVTSAGLTSSTSTLDPNSGALGAPPLPAAGGVSATLPGGGPVTIDGASGSEATATTEAGVPTVGLPATGSTLGGDTAPPAPASGSAPTATVPGGGAGGGGSGAAVANPGAAAPGGNPAGGAAIPAEGRAVDTSRPTRVIGTGTPASCTSAAVVEAVAAGGIITFDCGPDPVTIMMTATAKVVNANGPEVVLDGGGRVTLSGGGQRRILYMNTCDEAQGWTTSHCNDQDHPRLTVQNLTFADGNATGQGPDGGGGGAVFVRGGRFKVVNATFVRNRCDGSGPDVGGAALRVLDQHQDQPVHVVNSTFGGAPGQGGVCSNGGAVSSIGVSWVIVNSVMTHNQAVGTGANPARGGTPGGGSGGAIYLDGNRFTLDLVGTRIEDNNANEGGGAVFFVSNDRTGTMHLNGSTLRRNPSAGFETAGFPGIFFLGLSPPRVDSSTLE